MKATDLIYIIASFATYTCIVVALYVCIHVLFALP
jgi:hypothetical protein